MVQEQLEVYTGGQRVLKAKEFQASEHIIAANTSLHSVVYKAHAPCMQNINQEGMTRLVALRGSKLPS